MSQGLLDDPEDAALKLGMHIRLPMLSNDFLHFVAMEVSTAGRQCVGVPLGKQVSFMTVAQSRHPASLPVAIEW